MTVLIFNTATVVHDTRNHEFTHTFPVVKVKRRIYNAVHVVLKVGMIKTTKQSSSKRCRPILMFEIYSWLCITCQKYCDAIQNCVVNMFRSVCFCMCTHDFSSHVDDIYKSIEFYLSHNIKSLYIIVKLYYR